MLESKIHAMPRTGKQKTDAFKFLANLLGPENQLLIGDYGDGIPSIQQWCRSPQFLFNPRYPNEKRNRLYLDEMQYCRLKQQSPWVQQLDVDAIRDDETDRIWQNEITPSQAANNIARRTNAIIRRNRANPNLMD
jgi:ABC-type glycerol-3-phosphate transport system substrate-binding protein